MIVRAAQCFSLAAAAYLLFALSGCSTLRGTLSNTARATQAFPELSAGMAEWVAAQNEALQRRKGRAPFPGWGRAELTEQSERACTIRLTREWSRADGNQYEHNLDEAFIQARPQSWYSMIQVDVYTRSALLDQPPRTGKTDGDKAEQLLTRTLNLLGGAKR